MQTDAECVRKRKEKPHVITTEYEDYERNMPQQIMAIMDASSEATSSRALQRAPSLAETYSVIMQGARCNHNASLGNCDAINCLRIIISHARV